MRVERNLSQDGLGLLMPKRRHLSWVSGIENGKQEPNLADLRALAEALHVTVGWLITGQDSGDTEFVARLRGIESLLDESGQRTVLASAEQQVEETKKRALASLSAEEQEMVAMLRSATPEVRRLILATARGASEVPARAADEPRQEGQNRGERSA